MSFVTELRADWRVPSIAHYCDIFEKPFRLPKFDVDVSIACAFKPIATLYHHVNYPIETFIELCQIVLQGNKIKWQASEKFSGLFHFFGRLVVL